MTPSYNYSGKSVFVAGGTSGINLGIAHAFAKAGAAVGVLSRNQERVDAAVAALAEHGGAADGWSADVRQADSVAEALTAFAGKHDGIDFLVSGAAGNLLASAKKLSPNGFKTVVDSV